jgi:hypothetical protein
MLVNVCNDLDINLISSQPLFQGYCANIPLSRESTGGVFNLSARHLQFIRSIPASSLKSTIIGMKKEDHVRANLEVVTKSQLKREDFFEALGPFRRQPFTNDEMEL